MCPLCSGVLPSLFSLLYVKQTVSISSASIVVPSEELYNHQLKNGDRSGRDHMVAGFTTTVAISAYHHQRCEFEPRSWRGVFHTTLFDKVCQ